MEVKPVKQAEKPNYPLKTELNEVELKKQIPKRWMQCPAAKIALGTLAVVTLAGCAPEKIPGLIDTVIPSTEASESVTPSYVPEVTPTQFMPEGTPAPAMINVAPLFIHGEGRGAFGGVASVSVFLFEDEALAVINEAAKEYGLEFTGENVPVFPYVLEPSTNIYDPENKKSTGDRVELKADFVDQEHNIAIEFVSVDDVKEWHKGTETVSTREQYYTQDAAEQLSEALEEVYGGNYTAGVLYDPCESSKSEAETKDSSKEQLKAQAKDFFEWLKSQGVI